jgi:hypothetical protein
VHGVVAIEVVHLCVDDRKIPFQPIHERIDTVVEAALHGMEALAKQKPARRARRHPTTRRAR